MAREDSRSGTGSWIDGGDVAGLEAAGGGLDRARVLPEGGDGRGFTRGRRQRMNGRIGAGWRLGIGSFEAWSFRAGSFGAGRVGTKRIDLGRIRRGTAVRGGERGIERVPSAAGAGA